MRLEDVSKYVESKESLLLFVDRVGEIDGVSLKRDERDASDVHFTLLERAGYGKPYFQLCTVLDGVIQDQGGNIIDTDNLPNALKAAEEERIRFYSEREKEYGPSARPYSFSKAVI